MFEEELAIIDQKVKESIDKEDLTVFFGSSSIRLWETLSEDLAPLNCLNLGFGGSSILDCIQEFERLFSNFKPKTLVVYVGDNDIGNGASGNEVFERFKILLDKIEKYLPGTPVLYASIKPSPSRMEFKGEIETANQLISDFISEKENIQFLNLYPEMILPNGSVNPNLFVDDLLHLNSDGYRLWKELYRSVLV